MPNNYLSVLYKHIIQVENKNVGGTNIPLPPPPPIKKGGHILPCAPPPPFSPPPSPRASYASAICLMTYNRN